MVSAGAPAIAGKKRFDRSPWTLNPAAPRYVPASVRLATLSEYGIFQALASNQGGESIRRVGIALQPFTRNRRTRQLHVPISLPSSPGPARAHRQGSRSIHSHRFGTRIRDGDSSESRKGKRLGEALSHASLRLDRAEREPRRRRKGRWGELYLVGYATTNAPPQIDLWR
jgi:hypothetical protein